MIGSPATPPLALSRGSGSGDLRRLARSIWMLAALALLFSGLALQRAVPAAVGVLVLLAGVVAMAWSRLSLERVSYERSWLSTRAFVGESVEAQFTLRNRKALPVPWFEVRETVSDYLPPSGAHVLPAAYQGAFYYTHTTSLAYYERVSWRQGFACTARGYYSVGPVRLRSGDLFGLFPRSIDLDLLDHITVLPRPVDLGELALPTRRPFGAARGGNPLFEDQSRVRGLREYRPGDPLKRIDWKASARVGALQSRLYDPSASLELIIAVNADTFAHSWEGYDPLLLERAVAAAAAIATVAETERCAFGCITNCSYPGADRPLHVPASRDPHQLTRVLEALAMVSPFSIMAPEELIDRERRRFPPGASIAYVAGFLTPALAQRLLRLQADGRSITLYWVADELPHQLPAAIRIHDLSPRLREFERQEPLAYGGETSREHMRRRRAI